MPFRDPKALPFVPIKWSGVPPHLYKPGCTYFITTRLADAVIPWPERCLQIRDEEFSPEELMEGVDPPLCLGSCVLGRPDVAELIQGALLYYAEQRYQLHAWCIMPNHVHIVMETLDSWLPDRILKDWKGYTAREANKLLGRSGTFWERESFDHLVRTLSSLLKFVAYNQLNPVTAGMCAATADWPYSSRTSLQRVE